LVAKCSIRYETNAPYPSCKRYCVSEAPDCFARERALTRSTAAPWKPSTNCVSQRAVFVSTSINVANSKAERSVSSDSAPSKIRWARLRPRASSSRPPTLSKCSLAMGSSVSPASWTRPSNSAGSPCTNSAPSSTGIRQSCRYSVRMRPPKRALASHTVTRAPARHSSRAAARPAMPAPTTITSARSDIRLASKQVAYLHWPTTSSTLTSPGVTAAVICPVCLALTHESLEDEGSTRV
jgi:hypothetical protein